MSADPTALGEVVAEHRDDLIAVAYRMLGEVGEAEDVVQDAFLRLERHGLDGIDNVGAWLTTTTSRLCLDRLKSARRRREVYVGPWLPEPLVDDVAATVEMADSVSMAFLLVLESLSPAERVALLLHDVFGHDHAEVAAILDRSEAATRQLVSRARRAAQARRPRFEEDAARRDEVAQRFLAACTTGELDAFLEVLAPDVVLTSDGGGIVSAARRPVVGAQNVAKFFVGILRQAPPGSVPEFARVNGTLGLVGRLADGTVDTVFALDIADDRVIGVSAVRNPAKLAHLQP